MIDNDTLFDLWVQDHSGLISETLSLNKIVPEVYFTEIEKKVYKSCTESKEKNQGNPEQEQN